MVKVRNPSCAAGTVELRILLVSDAWKPQVNGVVRTLATTVEQLRALGHIVELITPDLFLTIPCPTYPEIRLALGVGMSVARRLRTFAPDAIHIATEGPLGWAARRWCLSEEMPFTTSFHTRFPDYLAMRTKLPVDWFWIPIKQFHAPAASIFIATDRLAAELGRQGLDRTHRWSRGVDTSLFSARGAGLAELANLPRPLLLYVGRVAMEKNIAAFLQLERSGSKVVVGDGPALNQLRAQYADAHFLGGLAGERLAAAYRSADVLVFPSRTDTFGLVIVEALASGTPVAAFPVPGPIDILGENEAAGMLDDSLDRAIDAALEADPSACVALGQSYDWATCTQQFLAGLHPCAMSVAA